MAEAVTIGKQTIYKQNNDSQKWQNVDCNSKAEFLEYGGNLQAISLCNDIPDFKINNDITANDEWKNVLDRSNAKMLFGLNEKQLFKKGNNLLGFKDTVVVDDDGNDIPNSTTLVLGEPITYISHGNQLVYLILQVETILAQDNIQFIICEEWVKDSTQVRYIAIENDNYNKFLMGKANLKLYNPNTIKTIDGQLLTKYQNNKINIFKHIPYMIFANRFDGKSDIDDVEEIYFKTLDASLQILPIDMLISRTFAFVNDRLSKPNRYEDIILTPNKNVLSSQNSGITFGGQGINFLQGQSQSVNIWSGINSIIKSIKEKSFMRIMASDLGKNNKQTAEIESINSAADDMLETKANLREKYYTDLVLQWKWYENEKNGVAKYSFKRADISVLVISSTKWLKQQAQLNRTLGMVNQNGVALNNSTKTDSGSTGQDLTGE